MNKEYNSSGGQKGIFSWLFKDGETRSGLALWFIPIVAIPLQGAYEGGINDYFKIPYEYISFSPTRFSYTAMPMFAHIYPIIVLILLKPFLKCFLNHNRRTVPLLQKIEQSRFNTVRNVVTFSYDITILYCFLAFPQWAFFGAKYFSPVLGILGLISMIVVSKKLCFHWEPDGFRKFFYYYHKLVNSAAFRFVAITMLVLYLWMGAYHVGKLEASNKKRYWIVDFDSKKDTQQLALFITDEVMLTREADLKTKEFRNCGEVHIVKKDDAHTLLLKPAAGPLSPPSDSNCVDNGEVN